MTAIQDILDWLWRTYCEQLDLPQTKPLLIGNLVNRSKLNPITLAPNTIRNLLNGVTARPNVNTCKALVLIFRPVIPHLEPSWFQLPSLDAFVGRLETLSEAANVLRIEVPTAGHKNFEGLKTWLCGVYVCYRYSIERALEWRVAREVLHIEETNGSFRFKMSYLPGGGDEPGKPIKAEIFDGIALPFEHSIFLAGWNTDRGRSLFMFRSDGEEWKDCRFGILSSSRDTDPHYPIAACTVLVKAEPKDEETLCQFIQEVTKIRPFDEIVGADFGKDRHTLDTMRLYLNNNPDSALKKEAVLRLSLTRFTDSMPDILGNAKKAGYGPFRRGWKPAATST